MFWRSEKASALQIGEQYSKTIVYIHERISICFLTDAQVRQPQTSVRGEKLPYYLWTERFFPKHYTLKEELRRIAGEERRKVEAWHKQHPTVPYEKRKEN